MPIVHAIVLGIVQGLAEFLPISSSGHLALVPWLFGWDDFSDNESLGKAFDVALHIGTLAGSVAYFRKDIASYIRDGVGGLLKREPLNKNGRFAWLLVASAIPAGITGVLLESTIEKTDDEIWLIGVMLIVFGLVLLYADRIGGRRTESEFGVRDALGMGLGQAMALQPGVSRSGVTITVGRRLGFDRDAAARISFLMSLPIIAGAGFFKLLTLEGGVPTEFVAPFAWGMLSSAVTGYAAVWGTLRLIRTRTFSPFVIYRVVVGFAVLGLVASGFQS